MKPTRCARAVLGPVLAVVALASNGSAGGGPSADLRVTITDNVRKVAPGDVLTYEITVLNVGPDAAPGSTVDDFFQPALTNPTWTCTGFGGATCAASGAGHILEPVDLPVGGLVIFTATATVTPGATGLLKNVAIANPPAGTADPSLGNNRVGDVDNITYDMAELVHGFEQRRAARDGQGDYFWMEQRLFSSYEVVVDETSGDIGAADGPSLERLASDGTLPLEPFSHPLGTGSSRSLRWQTVSEDVSDQLIRVRSLGCSTDCGPDDTYRIRAYDTTYRIARFNNSGTQATVLFLQNTTTEPVNGRVVFWRPTGGAVSNVGFLLQPRELYVLPTSSFVSGGGSVTVAADAPYGALAGKAVSLEVTTGFSFDTPMLPRPR